LYSLERILLVQPEVLTGPPLQKGENAAENRSGLFGGFGIFFLGKFERQVAGVADEHIRNALRR
jgi:hypothetical protein